MTDEQKWRIVASNLAKLVDLMITVQKGTWVDVFCDPTGKNLSFSKPSDGASIKLCRVTAPDLAGRYELRQEGDFYVNYDEERIPKDQLGTYLTKYQTSPMKDGAEWGWEFEVASD